MDLLQALDAFESYDLWLTIIGLAVLCTAVLPRLLSKYPLSMPIVLLGLGYSVVALAGRDGQRERGERYLIRQGEGRIVGSRGTDRLIAAVSVMHLP